MTEKRRWARAVAVIVGIATLLVALVVVTNRLSDRKRLYVASEVIDQDLEVNERALTRDLRNAQANYLDSVEHRNDVLTQILSDPEPAWTELRDLSAEMKVAEEEQLSKLEATTWPRVAQAAISELQSDIRLAIPYWEKAAMSSTSDDANANIALALQYCGGSSARKARAALHLPPA